MSPSLPLRVCVLKPVKGEMNREMWQRMISDERVIDGCCFFQACSQRVGPQDIKGQCWTDEESDGENESEQFLYGIQVKSLIHLACHSTEWSYYLLPCFELLAIFFF